MVTIAALLGETYHLYYWHQQEEPGHSPRNFSDAEERSGHIHCMVQEGMELQLKLHIEDKAL